MNKKLAIGLLIMAIVLSAGCIDVKEEPIIKSDFREKESDLQKFYDEVTAEYYDDGSVFETKVRKKGRTTFVVGMVKKENGIECVEEGSLLFFHVYAIRFNDGIVYMVNEEPSTYTTNYPTGFHIYESFWEGRLVKETTYNRGR